MRCKVRCKNFYFIGQRGSYKFQLNENTEEKNMINNCNKE